MNSKRIVIAGGSGFIGRALAQEFSAQNFEVVILTRTPRARADNVREVEWDGKHIGEWIQNLADAEAVINLTGKNINCPHTPENLRAIIASRVASVTVIEAALLHVEIPPRVWVQASAVGFYGDTGNNFADENSLVGNDALAKICGLWEDAFNHAVAPKTRKVTLRIGFVLGRDGGALPVLSKLTKWFFGGAVGSGRQYISWIHLADLVQMFVSVVKREKLTGTFNAVAPDAVPNADFMRELRRALHRPWSPPVPEFAMRIGARLMKSEASLALVSQRCAPEKFLEVEFPFQFPQLRGALENLCRGK
ncbi:MAG TPA: TIGR01777 family oxidoreductase [Verrucomicrobiae bacterium]